MNLNVSFSGFVFCIQTIFIASLRSSAGLQDEMIVQHVEGHAPEQLCLLGGFDVLEFDVSFSKEDTFEEILDLNPAIVCVHAVKDESANALYDALKDRYAHFYRLIPGSSMYSQNALLVASRYPISDARFTPFPVERIGKELGLFDFVIDAQRESPKHIYTLNAEPLEYRDAVLKQMRLDRGSLQSQGFFFCSEAIALSKDYSLKSVKHPLGSLEQQGSFARLTRVRPHRLAENAIRRVGRAQSDSCAVMLCAENTDDKSGKKSTSSFGYNAGGYMDNHGNSSAKAGVDYSKESKSGKQFSVGVDAKAEQNKQGDKNASVEVTVRGRI